MKQDGFTLMELIIVIAIVGILTSLGTIAFKSRLDSDKVQNQVRAMYADLMVVRTQALYQKPVNGRSIKITTSMFYVYPSNDVTATPVQTTVLKAPVTPATMQIDFDPQGLITFNTDSTIASAAVCAQGSNNASIDSIALNRTQVKIGKLKTGMACDYVNIVLQ